MIHALLAFVIALALAVFVFFIMYDHEVFKRDRHSSGLLWVFCFVGFFSAWGITDAIRLICKSQAGNAWAPIFWIGGLNLILLVPLIHFWRLHRRKRLGREHPGGGRPTL